MNTFRLPDLGEGLQEATIVSWRVSVGDHVVADQPLVDVETAKAVVEVPSPWSGIVTRLFGAIGAQIPVGAVLAEIEGEASAAVDTGAVVGELPQPAVRLSPSATVAVPGSAGTGARASPAIRSRAAQLGIDLRTVAGTGPGGAITGDDLSLVARHKPPPSGYERLAGVRRAMAEALARSVSVIPATVTEEADVSAWTSAPDITIRLVRAMVAGCRAAPALNAWFDGEQAARRLHHTIDLGLAVNTADGLFVPVLRDVATRSDDDVREALEALKRDITARTLPPPYLTGQTITLSNFGMLGGLYAQLTVAAPQVAILGAGRMHKAARVVADQIQIRTVLPLSLTFDHRCVTGAEAVTFLKAVKQTLEDGSSRMETQQ